MVVPEIGASDKVLVVLSTFRRDKGKIDYVTFWQAELVERGELWNDPRGTFRRTEAIVVLPTMVVQAPINPNDRSYHDQFPKLMDAAVNTLNRLIAIYRYVTEDTYIPFIEHHDINNTFEIGNCALKKDGTIHYYGHRGGFDNRLTNTRPDYDEAIHAEIGRWLTSTELIPLHEDFMMSAHFQLQNRNWRAATIEAQTAFEVFVNHTVRQHYRSRGHSSAEVAKIMKCRLANLITNHLPKAVGKSFVRGQVDFDKWDSDTYSMRNRVVHEEYAPSENEAVNAILGVESTLTYLVGRPRQRFWPKALPPTVVNEFISDNAQE